MQEKKLLNHTSLIKPSEFNEVVLSCKSCSSKSAFVKPSIPNESDALEALIRLSASAKSGAVIPMERALSPFCVDR